MNTDDNYVIELWEDDLEYDETGIVIHHPLNSRYFVEMGKDLVSYGHLTFAGHDLDKSAILNDVKIYYLEFKSFSEVEDDREEWANPFRVEVLKRLSSDKRCWYISIIDRCFKGVNEEISNIVGSHLNHTMVRSEKPFGFTHGFYTREFFEIPNYYLTNLIPYFWSEAVPGYPIEGYNMECGQMEILQQWDARPRDDRLFRDVIDRTFVNFYTFPAEHRYFVFVTNKLDYEDLTKLIELKELQEWAKEMRWKK